MKNKIVGILVGTLLIAAAVLPVAGIMNEGKERQSTSTYFKNQEDSKVNDGALHDLEVEWERYYGGPNLDVFRDIKPTNDGGYIMVGAYNAKSSGSGSHWLVKVDANGDEEWNVNELYDSTYYPRCYHVEQTSDGGFITAGCHEDGIWGYNRSIWKVDENGNTEWLKVYDDPLNCYHFCIQETTDGGYIVCGEEDITTEDWDVFLMKTDSTGNVEWQKTYRYGEYGDNAYSVRQTPDGGYILAGRTETVSLSKANLLIIKTDSNGNVEWDKTHGGDGWDACLDTNGILFASDGGYFFSGQTSSFGLLGRRDVWLVKTDAQGNMEWHKSFGRKRNDLGGDMVFTNDGGIIITATENIGGMMKPADEGLVIKTDVNGNTEWQHIFGGDDPDQLQGVCLTNDGGYIVAGNTETYGAGDNDGWLIKIKAFENQRPEKPTIDGPNSGEPDIEYTFTATCTDPDGDSLSYMWDWGEGNYSDWLDTNKATYSWTDEDKFEIRVMTMDEHYCESEWSEPFLFTTPRNKHASTMFLSFFENHPRMFPILQMLFQRLGLQ